MKFKLLILFVFAAFTLNAQQFYTAWQHGVYPARINSFTVKTGFFFVNYTGNDTVRVNSTTSGWYFGNINGLDSLHPYVVYVQGKQTINGGIGIENCKYFKIIAPDSVLLTSGGTNGYIKGLCDYIQVSGTINLNGVNGGWWIKTEAADACSYSNPYNYLYPAHQHEIYFTDASFGRSDLTGVVGGELLYLGSTGSIGDRPVPCLNNALLKPMYESGIHIYNIKGWGAGRTFVQISGADSGYNEIKYCFGRYIGRELNSSQGAGVRTGYGTKNVEIAYNNFKLTYLYNGDLETTAWVHDNVFDSAGHYTPTQLNPQQIQNVFAFAIQSNTTLILQNNTSTGVSTQPQHKAYTIYGSTNYTNNNKICNNTGIVSIEALPFNYTTDCGVIIDTGCVNKDTTFFRDSYVTGHFDSTFRDSAGQIIKLNYTDTLVHKSGKYTVRQHFNKPIDTTYRVLVRAAYDSVYICSLCQQVDTTICVPIIRTVGYGAFILDGYNSLTTTAQKLHYAKATLQVPNLRENWSFNTTWQNKQYLDSGVNPIATMSSSPINGTPHSFPTDITQVQKTVDSVFQISKPPLAAWLNEPATVSYWDSTGGGFVAANKYIATYNPFISVCHADGVKAVDGGLTYPIIYSLADYYIRNGIDSLTYLSTATGIMNFTNMPLKIYWRDFFNTLLPAIRNGQADYVQFHIYGDTLSVPNKLLTVLLNYIIQQTGKQIVTFETGTDLTGQADFNSFMTEWTKKNPAYMLYYLSASSPPVTNESFFIQFKTNNP